MKSRHFFSYFLVLIGVICITSSCKSTLQTRSQTLDMEAVSIETPCPKAMNCSIKVTHNTRLVLQEKPSGHGVELQFTPDSNHNIITIKINRVVSEEVTDTEYREELYFEVPKKQSEVHLKNKDLQKVKAVFGRFCFCPQPAVGYFKINLGELDIANGLIHFVFDNSKSLKFDRLLNEIKASYKINES